MLASEKLAIGFRAIAWFVLAVLFLLSLPPLLILPWWVWAALTGAGLLLAIPPYLLLRRRARKRLFGEPPCYLRWATGSLMVVGVLVGMPVYYLSFQVEARPVVMPTVTLVNGDRSVVFQGMLHVGSEGFYKSVVYDLESALAQGYRLYYEGVQPSTPEADRWFSENLAGGGDLSENYRSMADACGMKFQIDYFEPMVADMRQNPERHFTADVSTLDMKREYERLLASDPSFASAVNGQAEAARLTARQVNGFVTGILDWEKTANPDQRFLAGLVCRGLFNIVLAAPSAPGPLDPVVLDFRNRHLVSQLLADSSKRIYITYGAHHLPGVLALLKQQDPGWEVRSVKWVRSMAAPEHFEGILQGQ